MSAYGSSPLRHGRAVMQSHGYRNTYGRIDRGYSGYAGMTGGLAGPVTLARVLPGQAYSGLRTTSAYEAAYGAVVPYGDVAPTSVQWNVGAAPPHSTISTAPKKGISGQQVAQWLQIGIDALAQVGVNLPKYQGQLPGLTPPGGPSLPGNPGNSGPTVSGPHPSQGGGGYEAPTGRKFPTWGYVAIGLGALALGGGGALYARKRGGRR